MEHSTFGGIKGIGNGKSGRCDAEFSGRNWVGSVDVCHQYSAGGFTGVSWWQSKLKLCYVMCVNQHMISISNGHPPLQLNALFVGTFTSFLNTMGDTIYIKALAVNAC